MSGGTQSYSENIYSGFSPKPPPRPKAKGNSQGHHFEKPFGDNPFENAHAQRAWDEACKAHPRVGAHINGERHADDISLAQVVEIFYELAQKIPLALFPEQLAAMLGHFPDGAFAEAAGRPSFTTDVKFLWDQCRDRTTEEAAKAKGALEPLGIWNAGQDDYQIPPRGWLLGTIFCRKFLSSLIADGGVGKTAVRVAQALSLAAGRSLTGEHIFLRCRVLLLSFEDDADELRRRVYAALRYYNLPPASVDGWLFLAAPKGLKLLEMKDNAPQTGALRELLIKAIETYKLDLIVLDLFIKTHGMDENDNTQMDMVCDMLAEIAILKDCAIDTPHHTRKGTVTAGNADAGRGATAQKDAARLGYTLTVMTADEAGQFAIPENERRSLIRLDSAKVNIAPPSREAKWFKLVGVPLGNGNKLYPSGDEVQTVEPWTPPNAWHGLDHATLNRILDEIEAGLPNGSRYSSANAAATRAAWLAVTKHAPDRTEPQAKEIIGIWKKNGVLYDEEYTDPSDRKHRTGLRVNATKRPS